MPAQEGAPTTPPEASVPATGSDVAASLATAPGASAEAPPVTDVTKSPEYIALQEANRTLARQAGSARAEAARLQEERETQAAAAEAERVALIQQEMTTALGDKSQDFAEYAQLLNTDPVAAARKFAEMTAVQSPVVADASSEIPPTEDGEVPIEEQRQQLQSQTPVAPQPPQRGVSASTPLGQTQQQSQDDRLAALDSSVGKVVEDNQGLSTRARVTDRVRATAMGKFLQASYIRGMGEDPELDLNQRRR